MTFASLLFCASHLFISSADALDIGPLQINYRGYVQNDLRLVVEKRENGEVPGQFVRNEASVFGQLNLSYGDHVNGVVSLRPVFYGIAQINGFNDLLSRQANDPFFLEFDNAYLEVIDFFAHGLDLRFGRQIVTWGASDFFNPTNNINPRDFYDPLLFGKPMGTEMLNVRYTTPFDLSFQLIYEPIFRPARLPVEAPAAFTTGIVPLANQKDIASFQRLLAFQAQTASGVTTSYDFNVHLPPVNLANGNAGGKVAAQIKGVDISASYWYGRWDLPVATKVNSTFTNTDPTNPFAGSSLENIDLVYPRMHVIGLDMSTSIAALGGMGLWAEAGLYLPHAVSLTFLPPSLLRTVYGPTPCPATAPCPVVRSDPFVRVTAGLDESVGKWLYVNLQYLYGFVDEFGADFLKNYIVATLKLTPFGPDYSLLIAGVFNLNDGSIVAFPAFTVQVYSAVALDLGALIFAGPPGSKFANPEVGSTQIFLRGRFSF